MQLPAQVTVTVPGRAEPIVVDSLPVTIIDSQRLRRVHVQLRPFMKPLTLWEGDAYDAAGDYTQAQVEARVLEVLGPDIKAGLERLFVPPAPRPANA